MTNRRSELNFMFKEAAEMNATAARKTPIATAMLMELDHELRWHWEHQKFSERWD